MPVPILGRVLKALSSVYKFKGGASESPSEFETALPIQPVHDLSPMASLGAAIGPYDGWWILNSQVIHTVVGTLNVTPFITSISGLPDHGFPAVAPSYDAETHQVWVYDVWAHQNDSADFQHVTMAMFQSWYGVGIRASAATQMWGKLLFYGDTTSMDGNMIFNPTGDATTFDNRNWPLPMLRSVGRGILDDPYFSFFSKSKVGGTITVDFFALFWLGPKGVPPPRMG